MEPKYPDIEVQLTGENGNSLNLVGIVRRALVANDVPRETAKEFVDEALSGDYDNVLRTCQAWVTVS